MTTVLVAAASKHGATFEIAHTIARELEADDVTAEALTVEDVESLDRYDAVVLGSAVYMGRWLEPARKFVERHRDELTARKTWLFSSGPIGDPPQPRAEQAVRVDDIMAATDALGHRIFSGKLDGSKLSFPERAVLRAVHAKEGDYRNWDEIHGWAGEIRAELQSEPRAAPAGLTDTLPAIYL